MSNKKWKIFVAFSEYVSELNYIQEISWLQL